MRKKLISPERAFRAMFVFLSEYHHRTGGASELGSVLSDIQMNPTDDLPVDPAAWDDWLAAIDAVSAVPKKP
jgi:hypothetical protein